MTERMLKPVVVFDVAGTQVSCVGSIGMLKAIEVCFDRSIGEVLEKCLQMRLDEMCAMLKVMLKHAGGDAAPDEEAIEEAMMSEGYANVKWKLFEFLTLSLLPPSLREETKKKIAALHGNEA